MWQKLVGCAGVVLITAGVSNGATVAHWTFENGVTNAAATAANSIIDSANGRNGTPVGGPVYRSVTGLGGPLGLEFDGVNDRVNVADHSTFAITANLTVEAIIRLDGITSGPNYNQIVFRGDSRLGLDPYWLAVQLDGRAIFTIGTASNTSASVVSTEPLPLGSILHVAGILNDATGRLSLFVNGHEVSWTTTALRPFGTLSASRDPGISIGALRSYDGDYFDGIIAEARISNSALPPDQFLPSPGVVTCGFVVLSMGTVRRNRNASGAGRKFGSGGRQSEVL